MKVQIQKFKEPGGIIYVWFSDESEPGRDPYQLTMTVRWIDDETIEFKGLRREASDDKGKFAIPPAAWRAIQDEAARMGIKRIKRVRMNTGTRREKWIRTTRGKP